MKGEKSLKGSKSELEGEDPEVEEGKPVEENSEETQKAKEAEEAEEEEKKKKEEEEETEKHVKELKIKMMKQEDRNLRYLQRQFFTEENFDSSQGMCCTKYPNKKGVRCVMWWDIILFFNLIRMLYAIKAIKNIDKFSNYARARQITFYIQAVILFLGCSAFIVMSLFGN